MGLMLEGLHGVTPRIVGFMVDSRGGVMGIRGEGVVLIMVEMEGHPSRLLCLHR